MASAGVKSVENTPNGQRIDIRAFRPLVLDGCTIQIQMTNDDTASAGGRGGIFNAIYTIPLGKLDFTKIRTSYGDYYSREGNSTFVTSLTSSRDGEKGSASVTLPTIGQQKTISYVAIVRFNYDLGPREKNPGRFEGNVTSVGIDFKDKKAAENVAAAFADASKLCSAKKD